MEKMEFLTSAGGDVACHADDRFSIRVRISVHSVSAKDTMKKDFCCLLLEAEDNINATCFFLFRKQNGKYSEQ